MIAAILRAWDKLPLRFKGVVLAAVPLLALAISTTFAFLGNSERQRAETDVVRHFQLVSDLEESLTLIINAETGMRGFLLTQRSEFLQPYARARRLLPRTLQGLEKVVAAEPGEKPRIEKSARLTRLESLIKAQMAALARLRTQDRDSQAQQIQLVDSLQYSKKLMDDLRAQLRLMRTEEKRLLDERLAEIARVRQRDYFAIGLTLLVGVLGRVLSVYLFNTGVVERVQKLGENVRVLGKHQELPNPVSNAPDALGDLEREIESAHTQLRPPLPVDSPGS